ALAEKINKPSRGQAGCSSKGEGLALAKIYEDAVSGPCLPRYASTARSGPLPSTFDASTRRFPGHLWRGAATLRVVHFPEACVCVPVQRDGPVLPFAFLLGGKPQIRSGRRSLHQTANLSMGIGNRLPSYFRNYL